MTPLADVSIEFGHLYLRGLTPDAAENAIADTAAWLRPTIDRLESLGRTVSTVVMIDDYFDADTDRVAASLDILLAACDSCGLRPNWLVRERALAESAEHMLDLLAVSPEVGDESSQPPPRDRPAWLSNGQPRRARREGPISAGAERPAKSLMQVTPRSPRRARSRGRPANQSVHLDVELLNRREGGETVYSCPLLAAWWQLVRLGIADAEGMAERLDGDVALSSTRTLTVLHPRFIEVEHAVRTILQHVELPPIPTDRPDMRAAGTAPASHLDHIGYVFLPTGFATSLLGHP